jgi:hypothetical protein
MRFSQYDLGQRQGGEVVEVSLSGSAANVRLMDSSSFQNYRAGRQHRYYGGHATKSPVRLQIPNSGHWYVVIDLGGYPGSVRSGVRVLPGPVPPLREAPLSSVPSLVQRHPDTPDRVERQTDREFDVFISHASEDKDAVVRPLASALRKARLNVWYDEFELRIGDSLRKKMPPPQNLWVGNQQFRRF